jgi:nucleoid DNA-binding protein
MTRAELIERVSAQHGVSRTRSSAIVEEIFESIAAALASGEHVQIYGFGTFCVRRRPGKEQRDRATGEVSWKPPHAAPHFRPGAPLLSRIR